MIQSSVSKVAALVFEFLCSICIATLLLTAINAFVMCENVTHIKSFLS